MPSKARCWRPIWDAATLQPSRRFPRRAPATLLSRAALIDCKMSLPPALLRDALASVAWLVNAHLLRAERERFWQTFERAGCRADAGTARWLAFHSAVGAATPERMAQTASALLVESDPMPIDLTARVVGARLAALILMGEPAAAQREMHKYRGKVGRGASTQAMMRLLIGQMDHGYRPAPASKSSSARMGAGSS